MAIYHGAEPVDNYGKVPNDWNRDPNLSMDENGMLSYLRSHRSGYALTVEQMIAQFADGKDAIRATLNRLIDKGYVRRLYERERGRVVEVHYLVIGADGEFPQVAATSGKTGSGKPGSGVTRDDAEFPQVGTTSGKAGSGSASSGESAPKKTITKKTKVLEDQEDHSLSPSAADSARPAPVAALRERDDPATPTTPNFKSNDPRAFIAPHCDNPDLLDALVQEIHTAAGVRSLGFFIEARRNGTLPGLVADAREAIERRNAGPEFTPHPDEHDFEPSADGVPACARCQYPRPNARHRRQPARSAA